MISRQINELEAMFAEFRSTDSNPCGGCVYREPDGWRVHYADGAEDETFRTAAAAAKAIRAYVEEMRVSLEWECEEID